ncbi:MAG: RNA polymerase sigma factor [Armatimonadetes bacterium]|nr:RNA polymerase sigma factor [Armatimonadota bacterium]MDW8154878.1 RNA polymerase sigma factor [Armatimonadota bacterium]
MRDEELLRLIAQKDPTAFREWYDRHSQAVYGYLYRLLGDGHAAEDVLSEAMFAVWLEAARFRGECRPRTWLFRIARNKAVEWMRRRAAARENPDGGIWESAVCEFERMDTRLAVEQALRDLPREHREVVELAFFFGFPYEDIARILGCPVNTVKTRMFWAKRKLRRALGPPEEHREEAQRGT